MPRAICILAAAFCVYGEAFADSVPSEGTALTPSQMQKLMGVGINLGNRIDLVQKKPREIDESYFDAFKKVGFTNVRIPVCWDKRTGKNSPYTIDADFLDLVEKVVDWSLARGMVTVINTHHEKWLDSGVKGVFERKLPRLEAIWKQVATRFAKKDEKLLFEIFNEAHLMSVEQLNTMNAHVLPIIRSSNPDRIVMLQGLKFGNPDWIINNSSMFAIPNDKQLMLEIHNYDPFTYAGSAPTVHTWGSAADYAKLTSWVEGTKAWSSKHGLPIYYGEFGVTKAQTPSTGRDKWFQAHYKAIVDAGWAASVWNDGNEHLIYDYDAGSWDTGILADLGRDTSESVAVPRSETQLVL